MIIEGETGIFAVPQDVKTLEEGIQRLLSEPELCRRLGENARRKAENEFSMEDNINKLLSVYESVRGWER